MTKQTVNIDQRTYLRIKRRLLLWYKYGKPNATLQAYAMEALREKLDREEGSLPVAGGRKDD